MIVVMELGKQIPIVLVEAVSASQRWPGVRPEQLTCTHLEESPSSIIISQVQWAMTSTTNSTVR